MMKSRLQKLEGLKYENLKENIQKVLNDIPKDKYVNIFKGACYIFHLSFKIIKIMILFLIKSTHTPQVQEV